MWNLSATARCLNIFTKQSSLRLLIKSGGDASSSTGDLTCLFAFFDAAWPPKVDKHEKHIVR